MNSKTLLLIFLVLACAISVNAQIPSGASFCYGLNNYNYTDFFGANNLTNITSLANVSGVQQSATQFSSGSANSYLKMQKQIIDSTNMSLSFWVNAESTAATNFQGITSSRGAGSIIDFELWHSNTSSNTGVNLYLRDSSGTQTSWANLTIGRSNSWTHIVLVREQNTSHTASQANFYVYANNTRVGTILNYAYTKMNSTNNATSGTNFGANPSVNPTNMRIDEIVFYNSTINTTTINSLWNGGIGTNCTSTTPAGASYNVTNSTMTSPIIALTPQSLQLNITYNGSINFTNASFFYDGTLYAPTKTITSGNISNDTYVVNFSTPNYNNGTSASAYWAYNITFTNGTILEANTSNQSQTVLNLLAGNCTANVTANRVLNYSIKNVETSAAVSANSIFNFTLSYDNGLSQNFLLNYTGNSNPAICVYPSWVVTNYTVTASLSATGYAPNTYIASGQVSNTTNNINIFMTNSSSGTAITYNVVDSSELPLPGMTVQSFQYDVGTGTLTQVNSLVTDDDGQGVAFLILNQYFVWRIYDTSNNLVLTHGPQYLPTTTTSQTFIIGGNITTGLTDWITVYGLSCTVTNSTVPLGTTTTWNSTNANISNYCFNLFNVSGGNMVLFNQSCSSNQSGSLFLPAYNETSWLAFPTMEVNGSDTTFILWCGGESPLSFSTYAQTQPVFGVEGIFWALILLVLLMTIGFAGQGAEYISMILIIGWTATVSLFNLIPWGWSTFIGIAAFLIVWVMGMRRER